MRSIIVLVVVRERQPAAEFNSTRAVDDRLGIHWRWLSRGLIRQPADQRQKSSRRRTNPVRSQVGAMAR
jgi:hypothetical protein